MSIDAEGLQHFCMRGNIFSLFIANYKPVIEQSLNTNINWKHIYSSESNNKFIFIKHNNRWNYLIWNNHDISETINLIKDMSNTLDISINYYFVDGQIDTVRWLFSEKGKMIKGIWYQMEEIQYNFNYSQTEINPIISEAYCKFWDIYEETTQPIYKIKENDFQIYYGEFK